MRNPAVESQSCILDAVPVELYTPEFLLRGFDPDRPASYAEMLDTRTYRDFIVTGGTACTDDETAMRRALHDNGICQALRRALADSPTVAIMGGHGSARNDDAYDAAAHLASRLAGAGYTVASGGGPGVMEAVHLGAAFAGDPGLADALDELAADDVPDALPEHADRLVNRDGVIDLAIAEELGTYLAPAVRVLRSLGRTGGIGFPTWTYGHQPTAPFASGIAKFFQNSIREDELLVRAISGIVFMPGDAGTLQEVFQAAAQNYYRALSAAPETSGEFVPLIFVGKFWTDDICIEPVLKALHAKSSSGSNLCTKSLYNNRVRFVDDADEALERLKNMSDDLF